MAPLSGRSRRARRGHRQPKEDADRVLARDGSQALNDGEDLKRHLAGDETAFARILARHEPALLRYAANRLKRETSAEDAVQETFLRLLREARALTANESLAAWLFRVCRNLCADIARKEVRMQQRHLRVAVPDLEPAPAFALELIEERDKVRQLLDGLPEHEREVLILKVLEGRSFRDVQALLDTTLHDVFSTAHRGLRRLADGLREAGLA